MSTSDLGAESVFGGQSIPLPSHLESPRLPRVLHRLHAVRRQQGISLRRMAQLLKSDVETVRMEEREDSDLSLTRLHQWQRILDVPLSDLIIDPETSLSPPVQTRASLLRLMKTVAAISEEADNRRVRVLAERMADQLKEIMPELENVTPWHSVGQRRTSEDIGRAGQYLYQLNHADEH